ncbi:MAG: cation transport regulator ChaB [Chloroflexaceae bacterium]|nr:cation transport regulator ChaB [Chloroflexaceae bacterium]
MTFQSIDNLPSDVKEQLPIGAQQVFLAAFNSATSDGLSENKAMQVAWSSVKNLYKPDANGEWQPDPQRAAAEQTDMGSHEGARRNPLGSVPAA